MLAPFFLNFIIRTTSISNLQQLRNFTTVQVFLPYQFFQLQCTPLHRAALNNKIEAVAALISHGADVNARNEFGQTPLMYASKWGHAKVVEALLDAGADKELKATSGDWEGKTALDLARDENKGDVVAILERR